MTFSNYTLFILYLQGLSIICISLFGFHAFKGSSPSLETLIGWLLWPVALIVFLCRALHLHLYRLFHRLRDRRRK